MSKKILMLSVLSMLLIFLVACASNNQGQQQAQGPKQEQSQKQEAGATAAAKTETPKSLPRAINIGTHAVGSMVHAAGTAIASVVDKHSDMGAKVNPLTGPLEWIPMMSKKEIDFGFISDFESWLAVNGKNEYEKLSNGQGFPIRLVSIGNSNMVAPIASEASGIKKGSDLKGKKFALTVGGGSAQINQPLAALANFGLDPGKDIAKVPAASYPEAMRSIIEGRADAAGSASLGMGVVAELASSPKGARFISLDPSPEAIARAAKIIPGYRVEKVQPSAATPGIKEEIYVYAYDIYLVVRADLPDAAVEEVLKAIWDNNQELTSMPAPANQWVSKNFALPRAVIPYHPGAIKFFKAKGVWTPELEQAQAKVQK